MTSVKALESWYDRSPARTIVLVRAFTTGDDLGDISFGDTLHIASIRSHRALCGADPTHDTEGVTRRDVFCGQCFDAHRAIAVGVDSYELGELHAIAADALDDEQKKKSNYEEYLASDHWQHTRQLAHEFYGDRCCLCNSAQRLNVHHRTYERLGRERLADLIVLCRDCHAKHHGQLA